MTLVARIVVAVVLIVAMAGPGAAGRAALDRGAAGVSPTPASGAPDGGPELGSVPTARIEGALRMWTGTPSGIGGTYVYDDRELIVSDYPFDDRGANTDGSDGRTDQPGEYYTLLKGANAAAGAAGDYHYPSSPEFVSNAADIVEVRFAADASSWSILVVFNALIDPARTAVEVKVDSRTLIVHGNSASLDGAPVTAAADAGRNTFEVRVPNSVYDPGSGTRDVFVAAGLWDIEADGWLDPDPGSPGSPYFDVAFIPDEPLDSYWLDKRQAADIAASRFDQDVVPVDFGALRDGRCPTSGCPELPGRGLLVRTFRSGQDLPEGVAPQERFDQDSGGLGWNVYGSSHQPYAVYLPKQQSGGLVLLLHFLGGNHMSYPITSMPGLAEWAEKLKVVVAMPLGRGEAGWYEGEAEKDVFEVWRDVASHYRIDRERVYLAGMSMGGFGTWRLGHLYPDQFSRAIVWSGPVTPYTIWLAPTPVMTNQQNPPACHRDEPDCGYTLIDIFGNAGPVPYLVVHGGADELVPSSGPEHWMERYAEESDSTYRYVLYPTSRHETSFPGTTANWVEAWLDGLPPREKNPPGVKYRVVRDLLQPDFGISYDGAYWVSGLRLADGTSEGQIDARLGEPGAAAALPPQPGADGQGAYRLSGRDVSPPPSPSNTVMLELKGLTHAALDTVRMGWDHAQPARVSGTSDTPVEVVLDGPFPPDISVVGASFTRKSPPVALQLPAGTFDVTVAPAQAAGPGATGVLPATGGSAPPTAILLLVAGLAARFIRRLRET